MGINNVEFNEDREFLWDICKSPNCYRIPEEGRQHCCPQCEEQDSDTYEHIGHWLRCNTRHANVFSLNGRDPVLK